MPPAPITAEFTMHISVMVDDPLTVGQSSHGLRRIVPITGGSFEGPRIKGRVVPGGADWQYVRPDGVLELEARYTLQTDDGALIMITNRGLRHGSADAMQHLAQGLAVDPNKYYFRTCATFEVSTDGPHAWLNRAIFIGVATRARDRVAIAIYEVK